MAFKAYSWRFTESVILPLKRSKCIVALTTCDWLFAAVGCPDLSSTFNTHVTRDGDKMTVHCNSTGDTRHLVCSGTTWVGEFINCSQGTESLSVLSPFSVQVQCPFPFLVAPCRGKKPLVTLRCSSSLGNWPTWLPPLWSVLHFVAHIGTNDCIYRVTNFLLKLVNMLLFSTEKNWISIFWIPLFSGYCLVLLTQLLQWRCPLPLTLHWSVMCVAINYENTSLNVRTSNLPLCFMVCA